MPIISGRMLQCSMSGLHGCVRLKDQCIEIRDTSTEDILIAPRRPPCGDFTSRAHRSRHTRLKSELMSAGSLAWRTKREGGNVLMAADFGRR
jgi:hypothetical protein